MKGLTFGSFSMLVVAILNPLNANAATPFNLVNLARNGYFQEQGIPSHLALTKAIASERIKGKDLVQAAIEANRIPAEQLNNSSYVQSVDQNLDLLIES
jgi:Zn-finger domain-containing protein